MARIKNFWMKFEAPILLIGATSSLLIWAYSNFATANEVHETKEELRSYVDSRHNDVQRQLLEIKAMLQEQRELTSRILLKVSRH